MEEFVILRLPLALLLYGAALGLMLFDRRNGLKRGAVTVAAAAVVLLATAYSLLMGASMREGATILLVFLLLELWTPQPRPAVPEDDGADKNGEVKG